MTKRSKRGDFGIPGRPPDLNDQAEREAIALVLLGETTCDQRKSGPQGWVCTRRPGHSGDHVAARSTDIVARWTRRRAPTPTKSKEDPTP